MQGVTVGEAMTTNVDVVPPDMSLEELADAFARTHHHGFPVVDDIGNLVGVVSIQDLERAMPIEQTQGKTVLDIATTEGLLVAYPFEPMWMALRRLGTRDVGRLPVVEGEDSPGLVGVVRRVDIVRAYNNAIVRRAHHQHRAELLRLDKLDSASFSDIKISPQSPVVGKRLSELNLPEDCLIVSVRRGRKLHVAHGYTVLEGGDQVTIFADQNDLPLVRQYLTGESSEIGQAGADAVRHHQFTIPAGAACAGQMVQDLSLPPNCILTSISRNDTVIVPHGNTVLQAGDIVEIFGSEEEMGQAEICLAQ
jgi:Trk K+ transport system NAD-binding subunit